MTFWFLAVLAALTRALGDFRDPVYALVTAIGLGFWWRSCPVVPVWSQTLNRLWRWSSWALMLGVVRWFEPPLSIAVVTAVAWAFARYAPPVKRTAAFPLVLTGILYTLWWTVCFQLPPTYDWISRWSFSYTHSVTSVMSRPLVLGPSAAAVDLLLLGVCAIAAHAYWARPRRWTMALVSVVLLEAGRIIYLWMAPTLLALVKSVSPISRTPHLDMPWVYFCFVAAVVGLFRLSLSPGYAPAIGGTKHRRRLAPRSWAAVGAILLAAFIVAGAGSFTDRHVRVLIVDKNTLDFSLPNFNRYGDRAGGMFGLLPRFLSESGYTVYRRDLSPGILDSVDVVVFANMVRRLPADEKRMVQRFVLKGGGLLVLADHTGMEAIRAPTNDLLEPTGVSLNFDTAVPRRRSWVAEKDYLFHPLGRSGGVMDGELWLGASVDPGPRGEAFLVGRGAFSDPGDVGNRSRAYLGNLEYDPGEPLGDIPLAAAAHWGKGRVILFGDTSPFQNGTIIRSHTLINRTVRWLADSRGWARMLDRWRGWILFFLLAVGGTVLIAVSGGRSELLAAAFLLPLVSVAFWKAVPGPRGGEWRGEQYKVALLDAGHGSLFDGMGWEDRSIGGLQANLLRNGYVTRFADSPAAIDRYHPDLYILFAPTRPLSEPTVQRLERYINNGGWVMVSAGWNLAPMVDGLLSRFGLSIRDIPLGAAGGVAFADSLRMADAYPVVSRKTQAEDIVTCLGYPVVKVVRRGKGGLIVIGDSRFFYNKNLESKDDFVIVENVNFIRNLLRATAGTGTP